MIYIPEAKVEDGSIRDNFVCIFQDEWHNFDARMQVPRDPRVESWQLQHYQHGSNIVPTLFQQPSRSSGNDRKARPLRKKDGFFDFHELD
jgi:hypothetical protein